MGLSDKRRLLVRAIEDGLPLSSSPYRDLGRKAGLSEQEVISEISKMLNDGDIRRLGVVVRHRNLGYKSNAMVVWDIHDSAVDETARRLSEFDFVTLCYRRPRRLPDWPYNLFCMIHGRKRVEVLAQVDQLVTACDLDDIPRDVLFSRHCFKQRGAVYTKDHCADMDDLDRGIINALQDGLDIIENPFSEISKNLGMTEDALVSRLSKLLDAGILSRFGPLFNAEELGGGLSLAAIKVPDDNFDAIAEKVNSFEEVAHNYARDHEYNMWFVLATERPERINEVIAEIEGKTGLKVLNLPKIEEFFVGLRFVA